MNLPKILLLGIASSTFQYGITQIPFVKSENKALINSGGSNDTDKLTRIEIEGLGSVSNSQSGTGLSPSANVYVKLMPIPSDLKGNARFYLGFNIGSELDSARIDSIKLGRLFMPDRGKSGYIARFSFNILDPLKKYLNLNPSSNVSKYRFSTELNPYVEYNYNKLNIKDRIDDSSKIQTSTWIAGLNFIHTIKTENNSISFYATPFVKWVTITDGTFGTYQSIFRKTLRNGADVQTVKFMGIDIGLQINRFMFSFILEDLNTESLKRTPLYGGVYSLRATVSGDLIRL